MLSTIREQWFSNIRGDVLAGIVVALALIPEAIAFSIIAGVDPKVGLYASFCIAVVIAFVGGRPGMISGATGAMALLMVTLVKEHGLQYLLAATILTGFIQILAGYLKLGALMRFVSKSVVIGFVNALAILIFMAQLPELTNVTWHVYAMTIGGLAIIYLFPYIPVIGKLLPSPLICIVLLTLVTWAKELLANNGFDVIDSMLDGDVEKSILDYQEKNVIDMIVIGAYGHSKIRQFFIGSTTTKLLSSSTKPVLLLR